MTELTHDQRPEGWSAGAAGYEVAFAPYTGRYAEEALRLTGVGPGTRLLDVATGSGALSVRAARLGADVLATDFAPGMVELVRTRFADEGHVSARAEVMDGQDLALDADGFDAAFSMFGLIFFPDMGAGLAELARVVRPGGSVCISTWRIEGFRLVQLVGGAFAQVIDGFEPPPSDPPWARIGDHAGLASGLVDAGLVDVEVHIVSHPWELDDPAEFFRSLPDWSPPVQPLFEALPAEVIDAAAEAFTDLVDEAIGDQDGLVVDALIGIGRPT